MNTTNESPHGTHRKTEIIDSKKDLNMKTLQKFGGFAALYLAAAYLIGMVLFLVVLDYPSITDPAKKVALLVEKQTVIFTSNLLMYVFFGVFLIVLSLALYGRLKSGAPAIMQVATVIGIICVICRARMRHGRRLDERQ